MEAAVEDGNTAGSDLCGELEVLKSIYTELNVKHDSSEHISCVSIELYPSTADDVEKQYVCMTLVFQLPERYPDDLPEISMRNPRGLGDEELQDLKNAMKHLSEERRGSPMLYELIQMVKESLTEGNIPRLPCVICQEHFKDGEVFTKTECYHYFHCQCLACYVEHSLQEEDDEQTGTIQHIKHQDKQILCPVCREVISHDLDVWKQAPSPLASEVNFDLSAIILEQQQQMSVWRAHQQAIGGLIDVEAEKNKYLIVEGECVHLKTEDTGDKDVSDELASVSKEKWSECSKRNGNGSCNVRYKKWRDDCKFGSKGKWHNLSRPENEDYHQNFIAETNKGTRALRKQREWVNKESHSRKSMSKSDNQSNKTDTNERHRDVKRCPNWKNDDGKFSLKSSGLQESSEDNLDGLPAESGHAKIEILQLLGEEKLSKKVQYVGRHLNKQKACKSGEEIGNKQIQDAGRDQSNSNKQGACKFETRWWNYDVDTWAYFPRNQHIDKSNKRRTSYSNHYCRRNRSLTENSYEEKGLTKRESEFERKKGAQSVNSTMNNVQGSILVENLTGKAEKSAKLPFRNKKVNREKDFLSDKQPWNCNSKFIRSHGGNKSKCADRDHFSRESLVGQGRDKHHHQNYSRKAGKSQSRDRLIGADNEGNLTDQVVVNCLKESGQSRGGDSLGCLDSGRLEENLVNGHGGEKRDAKLTIRPPPGFHEMCTNFSTLTVKPPPGFEMCS